MILLSPSREKLNTVLLLILMELKISISYEKTILFLELIIESTLKLE